MGRVALRRPVVGQRRAGCGPSEVCSRLTSLPLENGEHLEHLALLGLPKALCLWEEVQDVQGAHPMGHKCLDEHLDPLERLAFGVRSRSKAKLYRDSGWRGALLLFTEPPIGMCSRKPRGTRA